MPDFAKVMAAAVLILAGLLALTSKGFLPQERQGKVYFTTYEKIPKKEGELLKVKRESVGMEEEIKHVILGRNILVSFSAGKKVLFAEKNFTVKNGVWEKKFFRKSFELEWLESIEKGEIEIEVRKTNLYAPLIIVLNGKKVYENYTLPGRVKIRVNASLLREKNTLLVGCGSSGWRLWAPAAYELAMNFSVYTFALKKKELPFKVGEEINTLKLLRLYWRVKEAKGKGNLVVRVNGVEIYRGRDVAPLIDVNPKTVKLEKGENTIELLAEKDTAFEIEKFELLLFYEIRRAPVFWFNISSSEYERIKEKNATLKFYIERITGDVISLSVQITDGNGYRHVIIPQGILRPGKWFEVKLTKEELAPGRNKIEFKAGGNGYVVVKNVTVSRG